MCRPRGVMDLSAVCGCLTEHEIATALNSCNIKNTFLTFKLAADVFIMPINVRMPTAV